MLETSETFSEAMAFRQPLGKSSKKSLTSLEKWPLSGYKCKLASLPFNLFHNT